jgi:signal transduction histidine kinase
VLAIRVPHSAPYAEFTDSLLTQLGELVSIGLENVRLSEAAQHAATLRDDVIAVVSHDLRSPLNSFTLGLDLLRRNDPEQHERICDRMQRAVGSMNKLIEDLLDVSSVERRELALEIQPTPVSLLFEELTSLHVLLAQQAGVRLRVKAHAECRVHADAKRLLKALTTLTSNAIKQTPMGGEVSVETSAHGDEIVFTISDSSPLELDAKRAFDRQRGRGTRVTGLDAYVAKAIVAAHGGRIWAEAAPGRGRRFCIALPRA